VKKVEWLAGVSVEPMFQRLRFRVSGRKLRLFALACWSRLRHLIAEELRGTLDLLERRADGLLTPQQAREAGVEAWRVLTGLTLGPREREVCTRLTTAVADPGAWNAAATASRTALDAAAWIGDWAIAAEEKAQCDLLRELFDPFRRPPRVRAAPPWAVDRAVLGVAASVYEERCFAELPVLADALEDAGCTDAAILDHCRGPGPHVRGCWCLDLILGKE
jgi:hypothetical protein